MDLHGDHFSNRVYPRLVLVYARKEEEIVATELYPLVSQPNPDFFEGL